MNVVQSLRRSAGLARTQFGLWRHRGWLSEFARRHPAVSAVIQRVEREHLTYLDRLALSDLADVARATEQRGLAGNLVEAGCALGGSAIVLAAAKHVDRPLRVYDRFGLIPRPTAEDGAAVARRYAEIVQGAAVGPGGGIYYGYQPDLAGSVRESFVRSGFPPDEHHVQLIAGLFEETLHSDGPVALAHLDCDWYESVRVCLNRLAPHIVPQGRFVIDDYGHWSGCRKAVDEFLASTPEYTPVRSRSGRLHLVRE